MAATQIRPPSAPADGADGGVGGDTGRGRRIAPRRGLPGGRAVVGGLLVAVAAVGTFAAVSGAGQGPGTSYVVAARDVEPGATLTPDDLELSAIDLPAGQRARAFTQVGDLTGAVAVGPLSEGELVQAGGLAEGSDAGVPTLSLSLPEANADAGDLQRGDTVQVYATYGSDTGGTTVLLAPEATVVGVEAGDETVATGGEVLLRLAVPAPEERAAVLNAAVTGEVALVRTTGVDEPGATERFVPGEDVAAPSGAPGPTTTTEGDG